MKHKKVAFVCDIDLLKSERMKPVFWLSPLVGFVVTDKNEKYFNGRAISEGQKICFNGFRKNNIPQFEFVGWSELFDGKKLAKVTIEVLE